MGILLKVLERVVGVQPRGTAAGDPCSSQATCRVRRMAPRRRSCSGRCRSRCTSIWPRSAPRTARKSAASRTSWRRAMWAPRSAPSAERGERPGEALARPAAGQRAERVLARDRQQDRALEHVQLLQARQDLERLRRGLGEVRARVDQDLLLGDPARRRDVHPLAQEADHVLDDVVVQVGVEHLGLRRRARMHEDERGPRARAHVREPGIAQAADVVDDRRAGGDRGLGDGGLVGVDGHHDVLRQRAHGLDHRHDAVDLLVRVDRRAVRHVGLAADVDDARAGRDELPRAAHPRFERALAGPVRERVRRRVEDAHERRPLAEAAQRQDAPAGVQLMARGDHFRRVTGRSTTVWLPALSMAMTRSVALRR